MALRRAGKGYVLGVNATQAFNSWIGKPVVAGTAEQIAQGLEPSAWQRLSAGEGTKGPRFSDWAYLELADLDADEYRRRVCLLHHLVPGRDHDRDVGHRRRAALGHRGCVRDGEERARPGPQRDQELARLASPCLAGHAGLRHAGVHPTQSQCATPKNSDQPDTDAPDLIRWSVQEIRRVAIRLAQRRIQPAHIIAWSLWRRAHQAAAQRSHLKRKMQL
jgi:hypothetical protein